MHLHLRKKKLSLDANCIYDKKKKRATLDAIKKKTNFAWSAQCHVLIICTSRYNKNLVKTRECALHAKLVFFFNTSMLPIFLRCNGNGNAAHKAIFQHCLDSPDLYILLFLS